MARTKKTRQTKGEDKFNKAKIYLESQDYKKAFKLFNFLVKNTPGKQELNMVTYLQYVGFCHTKLAENGDKKWEYVYEFYQKLEKMAKRRKLTVLAEVSSKAKERALWMMGKPDEEELAELEKQINKVNREILRNRLRT